MAQGDPPAKQWADSDGNVVAEIRYDVANDELIIDQVNGTNIDFQQSDLSNIASLSADGLQGTYAGNLRVFANGEVVDEVDPSATDTPLQDAINAADSAGDNGKVKLPRTFEESQPVNLKGVTLESSHGLSEINFTSSGATTDHGIIVDGDSGAVRDVLIRGPGTGLTTGYGIYLESGEPRGFELNNVIIHEFSNDGIRSETSAFEMNWGRVDVSFCDGDSVNLQDLGPANDWSMAKLNLNGTSDSKALQIESGEMNCGAVTIAGDVTTEPIQVTGGATGLSISRINFEPGTANNIRWIVDVRETGKVDIGTVWAHSGDFDYIYFLTSSPGNKYLGLPKETVTPNNDVVRIDSDTSGAVIFEGSSADINNTSGGSLSPGISCLADQTVFQ